MSAFVFLFIVLYNLRAYGFGFFLLVIGFCFEVLLLSNFVFANLILTIGWCEKSVANFWAVVTPWKVTSSAMGAKDITTRFARI